MIKELKATIDSCLFNEIQFQSIKDVVKDSEVDATIREDVIYIDTKIDDENDFINSLAKYVSGNITSETGSVVFNVTEEELSVCGDTLSGAYDVVATCDGIFQRSYKVVKSDVLEPIQG